MTRSRHHAVFLLFVLGLFFSTQAVSLDEARDGLLAEVNATLHPAVRRAWLQAIGNDQADRLERLIQLNDPAKLLAITATNGKSALMVAGKVGDLPLVRSLVSAGARIDETTKTNGTALMFAVLGDQRTIAEWLVERGADIHVIGSNGWTALTIAAAKGHLDLLRWLVDLGADAQVRDVYRFTPLMRAVENDHESIVALLLSLPETDVNVQDEFENTSLHHAVSANNASMVQLLLQHGADAAIPNRQGITATMLVKENSHLQALIR